MADENNELKEFIQESLRQIKEAHTGGNRVSGSVNFEIAVTKKDMGGGKVGIKVLGIGGEVGKDSQIEHASKISFETYIKQDDDDNNFRDYVPADEEIGI